MKECLACWEEIDDTEEVCPHCGSKQEEVKDYLALVLLKQGKKKIEVPKETPVLDYVFDIDPETKKDISVAIKSSSSSNQGTESPLSTNQKPGIKSDGKYKPDRPQWLSRPADVISKEIDNDARQVKQEPVVPSIKKTADKLKTVSCPNCLEDVPLLKYCKFCGQMLLRECPSCNKEIAVTSKFCRVCGSKLDPFLEKKSDE